MNQFILRSTLTIVSCSLSLFAFSQNYTGYFRTVTGNTTYHQFNRNGGGAVMYINQEVLNQPILRLSSGTVTANQNVVFTVENDGSVGIGTTTPKEKLSVKGNIRAQQVKVEMANWPDFVFEESYQLPSLKETEAFIKENKHLPGVPKAKEIEEDGLSLGEMNKIMMQKIEELTLHLIEKDKRIDEQECRIQKLESLMNKSLR